MTGEPVDLACTRCALSRGRRQVVPGAGPIPAKLVLVGEAPGADEDREGRPFVGRAGRLLEGALEDAGLRREEVFITNVVKCRPPDNRAPKPGECSACRPFLEGETDRAGAAHLVALGATAARALLGRGVQVSTAGASPAAATVAGREVQVFATLHPAASRFRKGARAEIAATLAAAADAAGIARRKPPAKQRER